MQAETGKIPYQREKKTEKNITGFLQEYLK